MVDNLEENRTKNRVYYAEKLRRQGQKIVNKRRRQLT